MRGINEVTLMGNLTRDPEKRTTGSGKTVAQFGIATGRKWKDQNGEVQEDVTFHTVLAWSKLGELATQYLQKGSPAYVKGRISNREYTDKNGVTKRITEIIANDIIFLPSNKPQQPSSMGDEIDETLSY